MRQLFRDHADARSTAPGAAPDLVAAQEHLDRAILLQGRIRAAAVAAVQTPWRAPAAATLLLPAPNAMIGIATTRDMTAKCHPPSAILALFYPIAMVAAVLAGPGPAANRATSILHPASAGLSRQNAPVVTPVMIWNTRVRVLSRRAGSVR